MSDIKQAYRTLGLETDASFKEVMEAHRDCAVVWDPKRHQDNPRLHRKATENLSRLNQAFQLIRDHHRGAQSGPGEEPLSREGGREEPAEKSEAPA
ncbi:MAG: J domain-containing protein, partial [Acidobacteria bacterium]|nr:J domain-containing protein [Acidobacteriota bacterium]